MHYFSNLFGKEIYMFRTDLLSIIRSLNTVYTATGVCHAEILKVGRDSWWWTADLSETHRVLYQDKFEK
jgi:hypothetical protein